MGNERGDSSRAANFVMRSPSAPPPHLSCHGCWTHTRPTSQVMKKTGLGPPDSDSSESETESDPDEDQFAEGELKGALFSLSSPCCSAWLSWAAMHRRRTDVQATLGIAGVLADLQLHAVAC